MTGDLTLNLQNTGLGTNQATAVVVQVIQGGTARTVTIGTIDGVSPGMFWQGGSAPSANANKTDLYFFNISKFTASTTVLGHMLCYG